MKQIVKPALTRTFGSRVATLRQLNNWTQLELAELCARRGGAISQGYLSKLENDKQGEMALPNAEIVKTLADVLSTTTDFLLARTDDPSALPQNALITDEAHEAARIVDALSFARRQEAISVLRLIEKSVTDLKEHHAREQRLLDSIERLAGKEARDQIASSLRDNRQ